uniref:Putative secreted peptide n=1 Tax=Anopheles braziliensis TaxID=58242 RepID=A0A2M3ZUV9_9DIPT
MLRSFPLQSHPYILSAVWVTWVRSSLGTFTIIIRSAALHSTSYDFKKELVKTKRNTTYSNYKLHNATIATHSPII